MRTRSRGTTIARRTFAGAAAAAIALTALMTGLVGEGDDHDRFASFDRLSRAAAAPPTADIAHSYVYLRTRGTYLYTTVRGGRAWSVYQPQIVEYWIGEDGSGRQRTKSLVPRFASPQDRQIWEELGRPEFLAYGFAPHVGDDFFPAGSFGERLYGTSALAEMPSDPSKLVRWLGDQVYDSPTGRDDGNGFPESVRTLELVSELLQNPRATPAQRAALVAAEALVPGIERLGEAEDEIGRRGVAIGASSDNSGAPSVYSLIYDPVTSMPLASEVEMLAPPSALVGTQGWPRVSGTAYLNEGTTFSRRARPRAHGGR